MNRILVMVFLAMTTTILAAGCYVDEDVGVRCAYGVVPGHYNAFGNWVPRHCR